MPFERDSQILLVIQNVSQKHFYYGPRKLNIILTQLCNSYSFLNYDLSKVNIVNDAACSCGAPREDAFH